MSNFVKIIIATIIGGIVFFGWGFLSWAILELHKPTINGIAKSAKVEDFITDNFTEPGVYMFPYNDGAESDEDFHKRMQESPFLFGLVKPRPEKFSMGFNMLKSFIQCLFVGFLLTLILFMTKNEYSYIFKMLFVAVAGLFASVVAYAPNTIWFGYPLAYTFVNMIDVIIPAIITGVIIIPLVNSSKAKFIN